MWLRAFAARSGYDTSRASAGPWLYGIARNVLREHWRAAGTDEATALGEARVDPWDGVDARLDSAEQARTVMSAIRELPQAEREVLLLVAWEQLTPAEAAKVLGVPQGTARSRLHRARGTLVRMLSERDPVEVGAST